MFVDSFLSHAVQARLVYGYFYRNSRYNEAKLINAVEDIFFREEKILFERNSLALRFVNSNERSFPDCQFLRNRIPKSDRCLQRRSTSIHRARSLPICSSTCSKNDSIVDKQIVIASR